MTVSRRDLLAATAATLASVAAAKAARAAGAAGGAGGATSSGAVAAPKFLTASELALLDELSDMIIPTDAQSPGARAAGVAAYIDLRLSESLEPDWQKTWRTGLAGVDALSRERHGKPFLQATADQRVAVLTELSGAKEGFFHELKAWTVRSYYTSKIGIQVDQQYKGNVYQRGEYAGYDAK